MRVTHSMLFNDALSDLNRLRTSMARTQEQAASGRRINRPSDDPAGAGRVSVLETSIRSLEEYFRNIEGSRARVAISETAVAEAGDLLLRARELAISGANGTLDAGVRAQIAAEVESLHGALLSAANTSFAGGHIFAGFESGTTPFVSTGVFSSPPPVSPVVSFAADSNEIQVDIEEGVRISASFDGRRIFLGDADGDGLPDAGKDDVFAVVAGLRDALMQNDPVAIADTLPRIDTVLDQLQTERTRIGATESRLLSAEQRVADRTLQVQSRLSEFRDADLAEVISTLVREENALRASLESMSRLLPPSLMDFLR